MVGGPDGKGVDRIDGPIRAQLLQQQGDSRVVEVGTVGGSGGKDMDRVVSPGRAQRPQQPVDSRRVVEAGVAGGVASQQSTDRVIGPCPAQLPQ